MKRLDGVDSRNVEALTVRCGEMGKGAAKQSDSNGDIAERRVVRRRAGAGAGARAT